MLLQTNKYVSLPIDGHQEKSTRNCRVASASQCPISSRNFFRTSTLLFIPTMVLGSRRVLQNSCPSQSSYCFIAFRTAERYSIPMFSMLPSRSNQPTYLPCGRDHYLIRDDSNQTTFIFITNCSLTAAKPRQ